MGRRVSLLSLCFALALAGPAMADTVVELGAAQTSAGSLPIVVAEQQGLFKKAGITMKRTDFQGGGPAIQALAGGSIEVCICAADHALRLQERGLGGKVIVALGDHNLYALMSPAGSTATDLASLKGQKLGVTSAGGLADNTLRYAIKQAGFNPDTDFQIIQVGTGGAMRAAVENGAVAAGTFTTPDIQSNLALGGKYKVVADFRAMPYAAQDLVALDSWLKANPETAKKIVGATFEALQMIQKDPTVLEQAVKQMFPKFDEALVKQVSNDVRTQFLSKDGVVAKASYDGLVGTLLIADPKMKGVPYEDVVTTEYMPK
jgi:NitT/TauT family transport system substrate-binding protein